ncbi:hypothetical protein GCM10022254_12640 [Actinomadura meridiana]|uniref:MarR family transcriptional regulator n=1 Tax=Actinomadura meridiana TaxID=559626 RepID=A0ABP8BUL5_9ACTN
MTTDARPFGTALIGQTEKALNAILDRHLAGTGISEPQWVTLTLAAASGGTNERDDLIRRVIGAARISRESAETRIAELATSGFLRENDGRVEVTGEGQARWSDVRAALAPITRELWSGLPDGDLATAGRVLGVVLDRANAILSAA